MLYYHNRIGVNFVSSCKSQLLEKNNHLASAAGNSIISYVREKWHCMLIHIYKKGEINLPIWHLELSTSVSVIKFSTITSAKVVTIWWQMAAHTKSIPGRSHKHKSRALSLRKLLEAWAFICQNQTTSNVCHTKLFTMKTCKLRNHHHVMWLLSRLLFLKFPLKTLLLDLESHSASSQKYHGNNLKSSHLESKYTCWEKNKFQKASLSECFKAEKSVSPSRHTNMEEMKDFLATLSHFYYSVVLV